MLADDPSLSIRAPQGLIYRVSHGRYPWAWPDWEHATDGRFMSRWDDPQGFYRVLYACSQRLGAFIETLARFRPDADLIEDLEQITHNDVADANVLRSGEVPRSWLRNRRVGTAVVDGSFVVVGASESLAWLHGEMAAELVRHRIKQLDGAAIRMSAPRDLTQAISRRIFDLTSGHERRCAGICYLSRLGDEFENWAIFEPATIEERIPDNIAPEDPDFAEALRRLGLRLVDG